MEFYRTDNGNLTPPLEKRRQFSYDLWRNIQEQVLGGRTVMTQLIGRERMNFSLPRPELILDFATITESDIEDSVTIRMQFPISNSLIQNRNYQIGITYRPPNW